MKYLIIAAMVMLQACAIKTADRTGGAEEALASGSIYSRVGPNYLYRIASQRTDRYRRYPYLVGSGSDRTPSNDLFVGEPNRLPDNLVVKLLEVKWYSQGGHRWYYGVFEILDSRVENGIRYELELGSEFRMRDRNSNYIAGYRFIK